MIFFSNLSIKRKLLMSYGLILALSLIMAITSILNMLDSNSIAREAHALITVRQERIDKTDSTFIKLDALAYDLSQKGSITQSETSKIDELCNTLITVSNNLKGDRYPKEVDAIKKSSTDFVNIAKGELIKALKSGDQELAKTIYQDKLIPFYDVITKNCNFFTKLHIKAAQENILTIISFKPIIQTVILVLISFIIAIFCASHIITYITKASKIAVDNLKIVATGDLVHEVPQLKTKDEFGILLQTTEHMQTSLNELFRLVKETSVRMEENVLMINNASSHINEAAKNTQSRSLTVAAASDEMVSTTADIAKNCENAAKSAERSHSTTTSGVSSVEETINALQEQVIKSKEGANIVYTLVEQSANIGSIVSTIDDIARQTNLLALNAAIEAARAGEAGKGFAVVADEVRALASRTTASTKEISRIAEHIGADANVAKESMDESLTNMNSLAVKAETLQEILGSIIEEVSSVNSQITQIATAAEQQTTATSEISSNMQGITDAAQNLTNEVDTANGITSTSMNLLDDLMGHLDKIKV